MPALVRRLRRLILLALPMVPQGKLDRLALLALPVRDAPGLAASWAGGSRWRYPTLHLQRVLGRQRALHQQRYSSALQQRHDDKSPSWPRPRLRRQRRLRCLAMYPCSWACSV